MIMRRLVRGLDQRLGIRSPLRKALAKVFPDHWTFMFGEIALYSFVLLVLTGVFLALFFEPSVADRTYQGSYEPLRGASASAAFVSVVSLSFDVRAGLLMRQTHHWAALVFLAAIVLHLSRIFFTGAFRKPREINWLIGVTMLTLALLNGFTGYSMPDDLLSGTGLRIAYSVVLSIPLVGGWLAFLLFGGEFPAEQTVPRLFTTHVFLVPAALAGLIALHLLIIVRQKHSQFAAPGRTEHNVVGSSFWPSYLGRTLALFASVLAVVFTLGGVAQINPVWIYGPFDPAQVSTPAQPDWYVAWEEGALRLFPAADIHVFGRLIPSPFLPGVVLGAVTFAALFALPFVEARLTRDRRSHEVRSHQIRSHEIRSHELLGRPRDHPVRTAIGAAGLSFYGFLVLAAADDVLARWLRVPVYTLLDVLRVAVLAVPVVAGLLAYLLARSLPATGGLGDVTRAGLKAALRGEARQAGDDGAGGGGGRVEMWSEPKGQWRWRYVPGIAEHNEGGDGGGVLDAAEGEDSREAAVATARAAYPGLDIVEVEPVTEPATPVEELATPAWIIVVAAAAWRRLRRDRRQR